MNPQLFGAPMEWTLTVTVEHGRTGLANWRQLHGLQWTQDAALQGPLPGQLLDALPDR